MSPVTTSADPATRTPSDGRHARSDRSRAAVAEALLELVNEGEVRPTAEQIARKAGVSIRSVFRHTADSEALNHTLVELHISRTSELFDLPVTDGGRDARIGAFAAHRRRLFEAITPVRRAVRVHGPFGTVLSTRVAEVNDLLRSQIGVVFAPELDGAPSSLLEALDMATSWPAWEQLRSDQGLTPDGAQDVLVTLLDALLP